MFAMLALLAALCFSLAGYYTKLSRGLTVPGPSIAMFVLFAAGSAIQAIAMRNERMAVTYVIVLGLEAVTAVLLSVWLLDERVTPLNVGGMALVLAGIALLKGGPS